MKLVPMICPTCKASIEVDGAREFVYCQYCGTKIYVDKEVDRREVIHVYRDEAKLKEIEIREREKKEAEEREKFEQISEAFRIKAKLGRLKIIAIVGLFIAVLLGLFWYNDYRVLIFIPVSIISAINTPVEYKEGKEVLGFCTVVFLYLFLFNVITAIVHSVFVK